MPALLQYARPGYDIVPTEERIKLLMEEERIQFVAAVGRALCKAELWLASSGQLSTAPEGPTPGRRICASNMFRISVLKEK